MKHSEALEVLVNYLKEPTKFGIQVPEYWAGQFICNDIDRLAAAGEITQYNRMCLKRHIRYLLEGGSTLACWLGLHNKEAQLEYFTAPIEQIREYKIRWIRDMQAYFRERGQ